MGLRTFLLACFLAGCGQPAYEQCAVACGGGGGCPESMACGTDDFCHPAGEGPICSGAPGPDGSGGAVDGSVPGDDGNVIGHDAIARGACPPGWVPGPYSTDFDATDPPSWAGEDDPPNMNVEVKNGALQFDLYGGGPAYASWYVNGFVACTGRLTRAHAVQVPRLTEGTEAVLDWFTDPDNSVSIGVSYGMLEWITWIGGVQNYIGEEYDPAESWWQLREEGGKVFFEVSSDGALFREVHQIPTPQFLDSSSPGFGSGTDQAVSNPGQAIFDDFIDCVKP